MAQVWSTRDRGRIAKYLSACKKYVGEMTGAEGRGFPMLRVHFGGERGTEICHRLKSQSHRPRRITTWAEIDTSTAETLFECSRGSFGRLELQMTTSAVMSAVLKEPRSRPLAPVRRCRCLTWSTMSGYLYVVP